MEVGERSKLGLKTWRKVVLVEERGVKVAEESGNGDGMERVQWQKCSHRSRRVQVVFPLGTRPIFLRLSCNFARIMLLQNSKYKRKLANCTMLQSTDIIKWRTRKKAQFARSIWSTAFKERESPNFKYYKQIEILYYQGIFPSGPFDTETKRFGVFKNT